MWLPCPRMWQHVDRGRAMTMTRVTEANAAGVGNVVAVAEMIGDRVVSAVVSVVDGVSLVVEAVGPNGPNGPNEVSAAVAVARKVRPRGKL